MTSPTSRAISRLGIGTYRLALGVPEHERVLYRALERQKDPRHNLTLIDTSSNYSNGRSEQLIGKVLSHPRHDTLTRDELVIATKFGYIQNENMRLLSEGVFQRVPPDEIVEYSRECFHCIHPEFMRDQLTRSLERLRTKAVDILFVHNPEYYLMSNVKDTEANVKKHQDILLSRMSVLFEELEKEIERGRIRAYGVSSNSFALKPSHAHFLPYQDLVKMATKAFNRVQEHKREIDAQPVRQKAPSQPLTPPASRTLDSAYVAASDIRPYHATSAPKAAQRDSHGLGYLQMPGNLLEMEGVETTARWAKSHGLRVFLNRPLNAMSSDHHPVRLASYPNPQSPTYAEAKAQVLETLSVFGQERENFQPKMKRLQEMIEDLDASLRVGEVSIIHMDGASVRNQLHKELASPVKIKHSPAHDHQDHAQHNHHRNRHHAHSSSSDSEKKTASTRPSVHEVDRLVKHLDHFVQVFYQQVRSQESGRVETMLTERGIDLKGEPIEHFAVEYLLQHAQVDSVLLGMKREPYVDFSRKILKALTEAEM